MQKGILQKFFYNKNKKDVCVRFAYVFFCSLRVFFQSVIFLLYILWEIALPQYIVSKYIVSKYIVPKKGGKVNNGQ